MVAQAQAVSKPGKASRFHILPKGRIERREAPWFWFLIAPWVFGFIVFTVGPIIASAYLSLARYAPGKAPEFIGFDNYATLYGNRSFWKSLGVTTYYTALAVPLGIVVSLLLAVLLNQKIPFIGVFRTLYHLPSLLAGSVSSVLLFSEAEKPVAALCHGVAALVMTLSDGSSLVSGKTVTGYANVEEDFTDKMAGTRLMPWRLEDALKERGANYVQAGLFKSFAITDGRLITGQQQYSGRKVAQLLIEALGH